MLDIFLLKKPILSKRHLFVGKRGRTKNKNKHEVYLTVPENHDHKIMKQTESFKNTSRCRAIVKS